ncbi:hypothetical protein LXL04_003556 [Taraxacum kok-saghyz]
MYLNLKSFLGAVCFFETKTSVVCGPHLQPSAAEEVDQMSAACKKKIIDGKDLCCRNKRPNEVCLPPALALMGGVGADVRSEGSRTTGRWIDVRSRLMRRVEAEPPTRTGRRRWREAGSLMEGGWIADGERRLEVVDEKHTSVCVGVPTVEKENVTPPNQYGGNV